MDDSAASYPKGSLDLRKMNRALRHRLRNLCAGVKMTMDRIGSTAASTHPQLVDRCRIIVSEMDALQNFTERMDLLFDALPPAQPRSLFEIVSELRESFVKSFPFCSLELEGPEMEAAFPKGSLIQKVLEELLANAGEAAGANGSAKLKWGVDGGSFVFEIVNGGAQIPSDIPLDPPEPFHSPKSRHDGIGLAIVCRICKESHFKLVLGNVRSEGASASIGIPSGDFLNGQA